MCCMQVDNVSVGRQSFASRNDVLINSMNALIANLVPYLAPRLREGLANPPQSTKRLYNLDVAEIFNSINSSLKCKLLTLFVLKRS